MAEFIICLLVANNYNNLYYNNILLTADLLLGNLPCFINICSKITQIYSIIEILGLGDNDKAQMSIAL